MLRRTLLTAVGLAAVVCLGGCVVHDHGNNGVHTRTTHHPRVFNVRPVSHLHTHHGGAHHSHAGGDKTHAHDKPAGRDQDYPPRHRIYHEDGDRDNGKGHTRGRGRGHSKDRSENRGNDKD